MTSKATLSALILPIIANASLASAKCQAHPGTCGVAIDTWLPIASSGFQRTAYIYDGQCNEIAKHDVFIDRYAAMTSRLPWTVNLDLQCGFEPCGTVKYSNQVEVLPGNCENGGCHGINACKRCWVYFDDPAC